MGRGPLKEYKCLNQVGMLSATSHDLAGGEVSNFCMRGSSSFLSAWLPMGEAAQALIPYWSRLKYYYIVLQGARLRWRSGKFLRGCYRHSEGEGGCFCRRILYWNMAQVVSQKSKYMAHMCYQFSAVINCTNVFSYDISFVSIC